MRNEDSKYFRELGKSLQLGLLELVCILAFCNERDLTSLS